MINKNVDRFDVFSASGEFVKQVGSFVEVKNLINSKPNSIFDLGDEDATIRGVHSDFEMSFNRGFQPQDGEKVLDKYNSFSGSW